MIALPEPAAANPAAAAQRKTVFRVFQDARGRWCARSDDGMAGGTFFAREAALRFVRRETIGVPALVLFFISDRSLCGLYTLRAESLSILYAPDAF